MMGTVLWLFFSLVLTFAVIGRIVMTTFVVDTAQGWRTWSFLMLPVIGDYIFGAAVVGILQGHHKKND